MSKHAKELDALWERAAHGTHREDLQAAYDLGLAAGRQELQTYGQHKQDCALTEWQVGSVDWNNGKEPDCTCGFTDALKAGVELAALRRPGQAAQEARGWEPIETAPKNGRPILVYDEGAIVVAGFFEGDWWDVCAMKPPPTHWQPLPDPPGRSSASGPGERETPE